MRELRFLDWREFQKFGCLWMQHIVECATGQSVEYDVFGSDGEGQGGVDLIPRNISFGVVGQSKCWNSKTLSWTRIEEELQKTDNYFGPIECYVILTTAPRHTSVQMNMPRDVCTHQRKQGSFRVRIFYWDELRDLSFVPQEVLQRIFPRAYALREPDIPSVPSLYEHTQSLDTARSFLPTIISPEHLEWLAKWDYSKGYVPAEYFDLFCDMSHDIYRVEAAVANPTLRDWLNEGNRLQLSLCMPAAEPVFRAIKEFAQAVTRETVSQQLRDGSVVYAHGHDPRAAIRITSEWKFCAEELLSAYRIVVEGASQA